MLNPHVRSSSALRVTRSLVHLAVLLATATIPLVAQNSFFSDWEGRATATQSKQPGWSSPLIGSYPMLVQAFRADFTRQIAPALTPTWNYGGSRGLYLIPGFNSEVDVYFPPFIEHNTAIGKDGFGDVSFNFKYRFLSGNKKHGNYMLSAQLGATIPTGSYSNGSTDASVTPALLAGKGFGKFDVISALGGTLPTGDTDKLGRSIAWNTTAQYRIHKYFWPEVEANLTHYIGAKNDGKTQNFLSPGITTGKFKLRPSDERSRLGLTFGAGIQIATTQFHSYNHEFASTARFMF